MQRQAFDLLRGPLRLSPTAHLKQEISSDDYRSLFEVMWLDRARSAGWDLHISYEKKTASFTSSRQIQSWGRRDITTSDDRFGVSHEAS